MRMFITSKDTIKYELSPKETKRYQKFRDKVKEIETEELKAREHVDLDTDYYSKRSGNQNYSVSLSFVEGDIGFTVYAECEALNLKENITDYDTW